MKYPVQSLCGLWLAATAFLAGCANVPRQAGFATVRHLAKERLGAEVIWDQDSHAARQIHAAIAKLLIRPLTPAAAVQIALLNNPSLQGRYEQLGVSEAKLVQAGLLQNPVFSADVLFPAAPYQAWDIGVTENFVNLLLLPARKKIAAVRFAAVKHQVAEAVFRLAEHTSTAYYRAVGAAQLVDLETAIQKAQAAQLELAKKLRQAGNIPPISYDQQLVLYERVRLQLATDRATALENRQRLNELLGLWGRQDHWTLPRRLPDLPRRRIPLPGLESLAIRRNSALTAAGKQVQAAAEELHVAGFAAILPGATVGAAVVRDPDVRPGVAGTSIAVPLPIFSQGQPQQAAALARYRAAYRRYQALAIRTRCRVREAWIAMRLARQKVRFYQYIMLPLRKRLVKETQLAYNGMYVSGFVLIKTRVAEMDSARRYVLALENYWSARGKLRRSVGGQFPASAPQATTTTPAHSTTPKPPTIK